MRRTKTEIKQATGFLAGTAIDYNGDRTFFANDIAQGDGPSQRVGNQLWASRFVAKGYLERSTQGIDAGGLVHVDYVRLMLVLFRGPSEDFEIGDILNTVGSNRAPFSFRELSEASLYRVLYSHLFKLTHDRPQITFMINKKILRKFRYSTQGQEPVDYTLALVYISSQAR